MSGLAIAKDLSLPVDAVTQKTAFLGRTGSGKTYGATKLAELMLDAGAQIVALDPVGVWYGLRLDKNGKDVGIEIPIFGGLHGDIPLAPTGGALLADLIVDRRLSAILDVSQLETDADKARFAGDFANRFFFRKKAAPSAVHLFLEECQEFVPQNPGRGEEHMLHYFHRLIKLGRNFGIGVSLISQRPQEVNKKALNQTECMFAFQMTGPQERKAISLWVSEKGADEDVADILPKLGIGEPHVWSPQWLGISRTIKVAAKRTFNASSTPTVGSISVEAKPLGEIDLEQLQKAMASTIEKAKESDPKALRSEVARLRRELETKGKSNGNGHSAKPIDQAQIQRLVDVGVQRATVTLEREQRTYRQSIKKEIDRLQRQFEPIPMTIAALASAAGAEFTIAKPGALLASIEHRSNPSSPVTPLSGSTPERRAGGHAGRDSRERPATAPTDGSISRSQQKILDALAAFEQLGISPAKRVNVAFFAGYTENGHFNNMVGDLRTNGFLDYPSGNRVQLTEAGRRVANAESNAIQSLTDLHNTWLNKLSPSEGKLLRVLIERYPDPISRADLGYATGYTENGHFNNMVGHLRTLGAADYPSGGTVVATDVLFPEGLS